MSERRLALVTGASSGIGAAFARLLAAKGYDLALTARREDRLTALAAELSAAHGVEAFALVADLADPDAPRAIIEGLAARGREADVLINNAGYGVVGPYALTSWPAQQAFLQVMVTAPCELAHRTVRGMIRRRYGRIVNVSSLAGLGPGLAGHTLYGPAKSLLIKFSESLQKETAAAGVHVTALCPGFTYTEIHDVNGTREAFTAHTPKWAWGEVGPVVEDGWAAVEANRTICVPGAVNKLAAVLFRVAPMRLAVKLFER